MAERYRVKELRSNSRLQPRATPTNTYFRPEVDNSKSQKLQQLSSVLDKMAPIAGGMAEAQYEQRARKVEAERTLDAQKGFTDWTNSLDHKLKKLPTDQYGPALDREFNKFMGSITDENQRLMMADLFGDYYTRTSNANASANAERDENRRLDKLSTMLWTTVTNEDMSVEERIAGIESVIEFGNNEFGYNREILNDWLVEKQLEIAKYDDDNENYVILEWMKQNNRMGVSKYQDAIQTILTEQKTKTGIALEVERARVFEEHQTLLERGQVPDDYYDKLIENGTFTSTQVEAFKADAETFKLNLESQRIIDEAVQSVVAGISGGNSAASLPLEVQKDGGFIEAAETVANDLGIPVSWLYSVISFETGGTFDTSEVNGMGSGATGLIQFMPATAEGLGTTVEALSSMSRAEQMEYVKAYLEPYKEYLQSPDDLYLAILYPKALRNGWDDNYEFGARGLSIYDQNPIFDMNDDGIINIGEVRDYFNKSVHAARFTMMDGMSTGTMGIPTEGLDLPNGKNVSKSELESMYVSQYAASSAARATALNETPEQTIIRELNEFYGNAGSSIVNPQWKRIFQTGFNHAQGNLGDGAMPVETSKMAMQLYTQMSRRAPHLLSKYMDEDQQAFYAAAAFYRDELKLEPDAAMMSARIAKERAAKSGNAEDRNDMIQDITDAYLTNDNGWFFNTFGNTDVYNQPEIATKARDMFDKLLAYGMNADQASSIVTRRLGNDYTQIGDSVLDVSHKEIQIYGPEKLATNMQDIMTFLNDVDPDYKAYLQTQGEDAGNLQIMQDPRYKTRFYFIDGNGNPLPPILEDGVVRSGILMLDINQIDAIHKETRTKTTLAKIEQQALDKAAEVSGYAPDGTVIDQDKQKEDILEANKDGVLTTEEQEMLKSKYGVQWNVDRHGKRVVTPEEIKDAQNGN